jgi:hypothetical protein
VPSSPWSSGSSPSSASNPALDDFADAAAFMPAEAIASAREVGKALGVA